MEPKLERPPTWRWRLGGLGRNAPQPVASGEPGPHELAIAVEDLQLHVGLVFEEVDPLGRRQAGVEGLDDEFAERLTRMRRVGVTRLFSGARKALSRLMPPP
jgi:hypothetical protein